MSDFKDVLITGGLGFIGSAIANEFLGQSARVTIVDSLISNVATASDFDGKAVDLRTCCVEEYLRQADLRDQHDLVVHAASYVGPAGILKYSGRIAPRILSVSSALAEACVESGVPLLLISSSEVYGINGVLQEDMAVEIPTEISARIEYALAKLASEAILTNCHSRGLNSASIRPFNVVGARQSRFGGFVVPTFVQQALVSKPLTVFGSGEQQRTFISVEDLGRFIVDHLRADAFGRNPKFNIGNPDNVCTINELAEKVVAVVGSDSPIEHVDPTTIYGPLYTEAASRIKICDIGRARSLGWSPSKSLEEIISDTADYFRENRDIRGSDVRDQSD